MYKNILIAYALCNVALSYSMSGAFSFENKS